MCRSGNGGREVQVVKSSNIIIIDGDTESKFRTDPPQNRRRSHRAKTQDEDDR